VSHQNNSYLGYVTIHEVKLIIVSSLICV